MKRNEQLLLEITNKILAMISHRPDKKILNQSLFIAKNKDSDFNLSSRKTTSHPKINVCQFMFVLS